MPAALQGGEEGDDGLERAIGEDGDRVTGFEPALAQPVGEPARRRVELAVGQPALVLFDGDGGAVAAHAVREGALDGRVGLAALHRPVESWCRGRGQIGSRVVRSGDGEV